MTFDTDSLSTIVTVIWTILSPIFGFLLKTIWDAARKLREDFQQLRADLEDRKRSVDLQIAHNQQSMTKEFNAFQQMMLSQYISKDDFHRFEDRTSQQLTDMKQQLVAIDNLLRTPHT